MTITDNKEKLTEKSLLSLGITTEEEFNRVFENEVIRSYFEYETKPTKEMYDYVKGIIERSNENVVNYLKSLDKIYDCTEYEKTSETVITGITKYGKPKKIVVRPSDGDKVFIYYQSEIETLDYEDYELWVDKGEGKPKLLTLGKLLKITGVKMIPLRKIF